MMPEIIAISVVSVLALIWIGYQIVFLRMKIPSLEASPPASGEDLVSIVLPARNEEGNIIPCLETLVGQDYTNREIIVVNDNSEDSTGKLVERFAERRPEVKLVNGKPLEKGWIGKTYALSQGVERAAGRLLLFVDADTRHAPAALSTAVAAFKRDGCSILSMLPHLDSGSFWERVINPFIAEMFLVSMPFEKVNDRRSDIVLANGQFLLTSRDFLDGIGGLAAIRENILDDIALARMAKKSGRGISLYYGAKYLHVRMYDSLRATFKGWSKNFYRGFALNFHPVLILPAALAILAVYVLPLVLPLALFALPMRAAARILTFAPLALEIACTLWKRALYRLEPGSSWSMPIAAAIYIAIIITSTVKTTLGIGVDWKGRSYYKK
jgi:chlorobactene glucosyltransferase